MPMMEEYKLVGIYLMQGRVGSYQFLVVSNWDLKVRMCWMRERGERM